MTMFSQRRTASLLLSVASLTASTRVVAQSTLGSISGQVLDATGAAVSGATVLLNVTDSN